MTRVNIKQLFKNVSAKLMQEFTETEKTLSGFQQVGKKDGGYGKEFLPACFPRRRRGRGGKRLVLASARKQSPQKLIP